MTQVIPTDGLQLLSNAKSSGELEVSLVRVPTPQPKDHEIVVELKATPINPSDLGLLFGPADVSQLKASGSGEDAKVSIPLPENIVRALSARLDQPMPVGNEGAGVVVAAGASPEAQALIGKTVAILGGAMYAQYRVVPAASALVLPSDATPAEGASCFVNPLTALSMVEVMRREGHTALVHTAAASNLGQMLNKICLKDGVDLVNIVRSDEQAKILTDIGAKYVVDSSKDSFMADLIEALAATKATIAFDAIGGGKLAGQILTAMEAAANKAGGAYSRYGSTTFKQVYIYGGLDMGPTVLNRSFGFAWSISGFLLTPFLQKIGPEETNKLRQRVVAELKSTFASHYTRTISLKDVLNPDIIAAYNRKSTGEKFLIDPSL